MYSRYMHTHSTPRQNAAHRADLNWVKVGGSEYMRGNGDTIRRNSNTGRWELFHADGSRMLRYGFPATSHSLTQAKLDVEHIEQTMKENR